MGWVCVRGGVEGVGVECGGGGGRSYCCWPGSEQL